MRTDLFAAPLPELMDAVLMQTIGVVTIAVIGTVIMILVTSLIRRVNTITEIEYAYEDDATSETLDGFINDLRALRHDAEAAVADWGQTYSAQSTLLYMPMLLSVSDPTIVAGDNAVEKLRETVTNIKELESKKRSTPFSRSDFDAIRTSVTKNINTWEEAKTVAMEDGMPIASPETRRRMTSLLENVLHEGGEGRLPERELSRTRLIEMLNKLDDAEISPHFNRGEFAKQVEVALQTGRLAVEKVTPELTK